MSSAMTILNLQNVQKTPTQMQGKSSKQTSNSKPSFLNLLRNAANSGRIENTYNFQKNNVNKSSKIENTGKNIILNNGAKVNDINNAEINLKNISDDNEKLASVLMKVLTGEAAELSEFSEVGIAEAIKEVTEAIIKEEEDGEKTDIGELLKILGVPAEIIPMMIATVNTNMTDDTFDNVEYEQVREISTVEERGETQTGQKEEQIVLLSAEEAADFIVETSEHIYSGRTAETIPEQVLENIADFAGIVEETADFRTAIAEYAVERIEANNAEYGETTDAAMVREIIMQTLNREQPEIEVLSVVRTSDMSANSPTMFDILNSMRKTVNITNVQAESTEPVEFVNTVTIPEITSNDNLSVFAKIFNGETVDLSEFGEADIAEAIKEVTESIIISTADGEKTNIGELLKILGVPTEIIPEIISTVEARREIQTEQNGEPIVLLSAEEAADFIAEVEAYTYSGRAEEALPEQVRKNIADFAGIVEENADFKRVIVEYALERIEANNAGYGETTNAARLRESIMQMLNGEQPETEVLSAVRTIEAANDISANAPTMFDILNSMRKTVNITNVQTESTEPVEFMNTVTISEITSNDSLSINEAAEIKTTDINTANNNVEAAEVNNLAGVVNAGVNVQSSENEVSIENFASDISQVITEKAYDILNRKEQGIDAETSFELRLRLKPAELGEIFMKISYKNGNVGVNIIAANAMAERAILSQMGDLRSSLTAQEINLAEFDVSHFNNYNHNMKNQNGSQSNDRRNNRSGSERTGLNNNINDVQNNQETERREAVANYIKSRRIFYKTI